MSMFVLAWALTLGQATLGLAMLFATYRVAMGPSAQDRVLSLDSLSLSSTLMLLIFGIQTGRTLYFEAALVIALLSFTSTLALAKFLMRGEVIE